METETFLNVEADDTVVGVVMRTRLYTFLFGITNKSWNSLSWNNKKKRLLLLFTLNCETVSDGNINLQCVL